MADYYKNANDAYTSATKNLAYLEQLSNAIDNRPFIREPAAKCLTLSERWVQAWEWIWKGWKTQN